MNFGMRRENKVDYVANKTIKYSIVKIHISIIKAHHRKLKMMNHKIPIQIKEQDFSISYPRI